MDDNINGASVAAEDAIAPDAVEAVLLSQSS